MLEPIPAGNRSTRSRSYGFVVCARARVNGLCPISQVYSSLAEHRESVLPHTVYRPPVGSFLPPINNTSGLAGRAKQHSLLQSYRPYLAVKDGKLALGNLSRFNSFSFHQPPIFVVGLTGRRLRHSQERTFSKCLRESPLFWGVSGAGAADPQSGADLQWHFGPALPTRKKHAFVDEHKQRLQS